MLEDSNSMMANDASMQTKSVAKWKERFGARRKEQEEEKSNSDGAVKKQQDSTEKEVGFKSFPNLPGALGALPNLFLRSALFGISSSEKSLLREKILAPKGYDIYVTGIQLTIDDLRYLDVLFSFADSNEKCQFTRYKFLQLMGKTDSSNNYKLLNKFFSKIIANSIEIVDNSKTMMGYEGSIIMEKMTNEATSLLTRV